MSDEQYTSRAQRRAQRPARQASNRPRIAAGVVALVALAGLGGYAVTHRGSSDTAAGATGTTTCSAARVQVAADPSISEALTKALAGFTGGKDSQGCARTYGVTTMSNADVVKQISGGSPAAQIWVADSPQWFAKASAAAKTTITPGAAFAATPVVISGPPTQIQTLGIPASTWARVVAAKPSLTTADAATDRASALAVTRAEETLGKNSQTQAALGALATTARTTIPSDAPHVTTEQALTRWNAANHGSLAETALQGGSPLVTLRAAPLVSGDPETDAAMKELTTYLTSDKGHDALASAGFRTPDGASAPPNAPHGASGLTIGPTPADTNVDATVAMWQQATKPLRLTTVIDVSGSMNEKVDGVSRIDEVSQTAVQALDAVPNGTSIALWEFSSALQGKQDYKELVPMGLVSDRTQHAKLESAAKALPTQVKGDTGLYDSLWAAFQSAQRDYRPGQISTVAIITDGQNDDTTGGLTLRQLTDKIKASVSKDKPVDISPIAIGDDVDLQVLGDIAKLTGGKVYTAKTPSQIPSVLTASLLDRS